MSQLVLEGQVDNSSKEIQRLEDEVARLQDELRKARTAALDREHEARKAVAAMFALREALGPIYRGLQGVFGELAIVEEVFPASASGTRTTTAEAPRVSAVWDTWINKLGGLRANFIKALLEHGEMTVEQLRVTCHCSKQSVYNNTDNLYKLGLVNRNNGRYSLKQI